MDPEQWELVGVLAKTQGKDGELLLKLKRELPEAHRLEDPVFIPAERADDPLPFYLTRLQRISKKHYAVRIDLVDDAERASELIGLEVWLPRSAFPEGETQGDLLTRLQGFHVIDKEKGELGKVTGGIERSEQPVLLVGDTEIPIPLTEAFIEEVDEEGKRLYMDLPEGLTEL